jgi:hypothetical protein
VTGPTVPAAVEAFMAAVGADNPAKAGWVSDRQVVVGMAAALRALLDTGWTPPRKPIEWVDGDELPEWERELLEVQAAREEMREALGGERP